MWLLSITSFSQPHDTLHDSYLCSAHLVRHRSLGKRRPRSISINHLVTSTIAGYRERVKLLVSSSLLFILLPLVQSAILAMNPDILWQALKDECCVNPKTALRLILLERPAFDRAFEVTRVKWLKSLPAGYLRVNDLLEFVTHKPHDPIVIAPVQIDPSHQITS